MTSRKNNPWTRERQTDRVLKRRQLWTMTHTWRKTVRMRVRQEQKLSDRKTLGEN